MTKEEILDNNKVIAKFMQLHGWEDDRYGYMWTNPVNKTSSFSLCYDSSWDWLMPVIQKINDTQQHEAAIRDLQYTIQYLLSGGYGFTEYSRKKATLTLQNLWERAVIFIKWYNDQKKK